MKHTCETIYFSKAVQLELLVKTFSLNLKTINYQPKSHQLLVKNLKAINYFGESSQLATLQI